MESPGQRARRLSELLTEDELLAELADDHAALTKAYAEFRDLVARRRLITAALLAREGMSQRKIAAHLGLSQAAVARYMSGGKSG